MDFVKAYVIVACYVPPMDSDPIWVQREQDIKKKIGSTKTR